MKKFISLCLALVLFLSFSVTVAAEAIPQKAATEETFYCADNAELLSDETKAVILSENQSLRSDLGAEIVVVTVDSTDGMDAVSFAEDLGSIWGVGSREYNNGAVLLITKNDGGACVALGSGLDGARESAEKIVSETILPQLDEGNYDGAVRGGFDALVALLRERAVGGEIPFYSFMDFRENAAGGMSKSNLRNGTVGFLIAFVCIAVLFVVALLLLGTKGRYGYGYRNGFPFMPWLFMGKSYRPNVFKKRRFGK